MSTFYGDMYGERRKRIGLKLGGIVGVAAVLAGGCVAAYALSDTVKNQVKLAFSSPQDYFTWVCEKNADDFSEAFAGSYQQVLDARSQGMHTHAEAQVILTEEGRNAMQADLPQRSLTSGNLVGQIIEQQAVNVLANLEDIGITSDISEKGNSYQQSIGLKLNGEQIISAETAADVKDQLLYFRVPEFKEQWLGIELGSFWEEAFSKAMPVFGDDEMLAAQEMQQMIREYSLIPTENISDVTVTRSVPVTVAGQETDYTEIVFSLTPDQFVESVQKIVDKAAQDERIRKAFHAADVYDEIIEAAKESVSEMKANAGDPVQIRFYVHDIGAICGFSITGEDGTYLFAAAYRKGDQLAAEIRTANDTESEPAVLTVRAVRSGDAVNGTAVMKVGSHATVTAAFTDLKIVDLKKCYVSGTIAISSDRTDDEFTVKLDGSNGQTAEFPIRIDGTEYAAVSLCYSVDEGAGVVVPERSTAYFIDPTDPDSYKGYLDAASIQKFIKDTTGKLGINNEDADRAGKAAGFVAAINQFEGIL